MALSLRKWEREQGLTDVQVLARLFRYYRWRFPREDLSQWLIRALRARRCYRGYYFQVYRARVLSEVHRLDVEQKQLRLKKASLPKALRVAKKQEEQSARPSRRDIEKALAGLERERHQETLEEARDEAPEFFCRFEDALWRRLSPFDRVSTELAAIERGDHLLPDS